MLSGGKMDQFLQAIYRQHQNAAYMNAAYLESYKELAKLQAQQEKELRRIESERAKKPVSVIEINIYPKFFFVFGMGNFFVPRKHRVTNLFGNFFFSCHALIFMSDLFLTIHFELRVCLAQ